MDRLVSSHSNRVKTIDISPFVGFITNKVLYTDLAVAYYNKWMKSFYEHARDISPSYVSL